MQSVADLVRAAMQSRREHEVRNAPFEELVRRFQDMVFAYALAVVRDVETAQDVTQEAFLAAFQKLASLRDPAAFPGWLRQITKRCCLMELRRRHPEPVEPATLEALPAWEGTDCGGPVSGVRRRQEDADQTDEATDQVRRAIDELPEDQRVSIVLYYIDGFSQKEIAEFLDVQLSAIKKRLQRGRDAMRKKLEQSVRDSLSRVRPSRSDELVETVSLYASFDMAAQLGQFCLIEAMLVDGIDVNQTDAAGRTLLHWAVDHDHLEAVELLLSCGADPTIPDRSGRTAAAAAKDRANPRVISLLEARS